MGQVLSGRFPIRTVVSFRKTGWFFGVLLAAAASPSAAKDRPPEPVENPGECPIDAPLRVANLDSLRQFEGLIGHCPESSVIESPAYQANKPRPVPVDHTIDDMWHDDDGPRGGRMILVDAGADAEADDRNAASERPARARTLRRSDGRAVAIVPPSTAFADDMIAPGETVALDTDADGQAEAILALRPQSYTTPFDAKIAAAARRHRVDPLLLHAVITQESRYKDRAVSHAGARGLMQVMPATGRSLGVRNADHLFDAETNINAGAKLLSSLWGRLDGNIDLVLAAYNAGEGAVRKYGMKVPPYRETQDYVVKVKAYYAKLAGESGLAVNF